MKEIVNKIREAYEHSNVPHMAIYSKYIAKKVITSVIKEEYSILDEFDYELSELLEDLNYENSIDKVEYYLGYICAYENAAQKIAREGTYNNLMEQVITSDHRALKIIQYLIKNKYASHSEIAAYLDISASGLSGFFNKKSIKEANLFGFNKIGKNKYYYLTNKVKSFYLNNYQDSEKIYTENDLIKLLELIHSDNEDLSKDNIQKYINVFSKKLVDKIYKSYIDYKDRTSMNSIDKVIQISKRDQSKKQFSNENKEVEQFDYSQPMTEKLLA